jgi:hypothetical protein
MLANPVMFPPGRSSRGTIPLATGSLTFAKTIGIVRVSRWTAAVAGSRIHLIAKGGRQPVELDCRFDQNSYLD